MTHLPNLHSVLNRSKRNFLMIAHRARSDGKIQLNDLCGASGRWDGIARAITASLFLSHDMRRDTAFHVLLLGQDDPPKLLTIDGKDVRYLNPDERASSALMRKCLGHQLGGEMDEQISPSHGITITRVDLESVLNTMEGHLFLMDEDGEEPPTGSIEDIIKNEVPFHFILSDDMDLTDIERQMAAGKAERIWSLGPFALHTNQVITIIHFILDNMDSELA